MAFLEDRWPTANLPPVRAVITGGAGFIGSHLADQLLTGGHDVILLDDLSTGRLANIDHLRHRSGAEFVLGSILDEDLVDSVVARCDTVFHLAAAVGVKLIVERPLESLRTNIRGSEIVLDTVHRHGARILVTSTSEIYGKNDSDSLREDDDRILGSPLKSRWSYSEAKAIDEILAYTYWREKGVHAVIVRLFNTVGPRQTGRYGMVIPRFVEQAMRNEDITVYGDGTQTRCFCSVHDAVWAMVALMEDPGAVGQVFNIGGTEEVSMLDLATRVKSAVDSRSRIVFIPYDEAYEGGFEDMQRRVPNIDKIRARVGYEPRIGLDEMITSVIEDVRR